MKVTIDTVRCAESILLETRREYLVDHGWAQHGTRWWKEFPWGRESTRKIEADLIDAVEYQAKVDEP